MLKSPNSAIGQNDERIEQVQDVIQTLILISDCNQQLVRLLSGYASGVLAWFLDILIGQSVDAWIIKMSSDHNGTLEKNLFWCIGVSQESPKVGWTWDRCHNQMVLTLIFWVYARELSQIMFVLRGGWMVRKPCSLLHKKSKIGMYVVKNCQKIET